MFFIQLLKNRIKSQLGKDLLRTFCVRLVAATGALAFALIIGRLFGPSGVGVYALAYGILLGIGVLCRLGMDNALMRFVGSDIDSPFAKTYLLWAVKWCLSLSCCASLLLYLFRFYLEEVFSAPGLSSVLVGISIAAPAYTLSFALSGFFKGVRKPATASLMENGLISLLACSILLMFKWLYPSPDLAILGYSYSIAAWFVAIHGVFKIIFWFRNSTNNSLVERGGSLSLRKDPAPVSYARFMTTSRAFFVTGLAGFMQSVLGVMIAGLLLTNAELGLFKSAQQLAVLIGFILVVIDAIFPPRFAHLYHQGELQALERLAKQGALLGLIFASPLLILCLSVPGWMLGWYGEEFKDGANLLRIITIANLVNVATGSVSFLLNMTGHERLMRNIALSCNALGLIAFFVLPQVLGALGAALALSFIFVVQNLTAMFFVWRRLGIWTLPSPNFLRWLGIRSVTV